LRGLCLLFRLAGRHHELHREINGFSISHSDVEVRIWGHYAVINDEGAKYYRHSIAEFNISPTVREDNRWAAYTFVRNVYDLWLPKHFERICSVIDMLPADLNSVIAELRLEQSASRSGLSQQFEGHGVGDRAVPEGQPSGQPITPDTAFRTGS
jgi:hypothetical protein